MAHITYTVFHRQGWRVAIGDTESAPFASKDEAIGLANVAASFRRQAGDDVEVAFHHPGDGTETLWRSGSKREA